MSNEKEIKLTEAQKNALYRVNRTARCEHKVYVRPATDFFKAGFDVVRLNDQYAAGGGLTIDAALKNAMELYTD